MTTENQQACTPVFAYDIAEAFYKDCCQECPKELEWVHGVTRLLGQHLASAGHTCDWSKLSVSSFLHEIGFMSENEQMGVCITLIGLYTWLGTTEVVPMAVSIEMLQRVQEECGEPDALDSLVKSGIDLLVVSAALEEDDGEDELAEFDDDDEQCILWN